MRSRLGAIALVPALAVLAGVVPPGPVPEAEARPSSNRSPEHVILLDWDGFDPDYLDLASTPNLDALVGQGSLATASSTFHTVSNPARASMVTGAYPQVHGNAAYYYDPALGRAVGQERVIATETIAEALTAEGRTVAAVQWYLVEDRGTAYGDPDHLYVQPGGTFGDRVDVAIDIMRGRPVDSNGSSVIVDEVPDLLAVYTDQPDALGHAEGAESPRLPALVAELDFHLGRLVQATKDLGIFDDTTWLLTADHGMTTWDRTLIPDVLTALSGAGFRPEVVRPGRTPAPETDVVLVPNSVRVGDFSFRGAAATPERRAEAKAVLEGLTGRITRVFDDADLAGLRASDKLGDLVAEAEPPYGFALGEPPVGTVRGSHGSTAELAVPFILSGAGVVPGRPPNGAGLVDVAPTIAALLGVRPPDGAQGRVLRESLGPRVGGELAPLRPVRPARRPRTP